MQLGSLEDGAEHEDGAAEAGEESADCDADAGKEAADDTRERILSIVGRAGHCVTGEGRETFSSSQ